jgi:two-component system, response regulator PdtaR
VVIVSAYSDPAKVEGAAGAGVFGFLVKPVSTDQLRAAISVAWERFNELISVQKENSDLRRRLEERKTIERAKWVLVEKRSMTEPEAMDALRAMARDHRRPMIETALEVLRSAEGA